MGTFVQPEDIANRGLQHLGATLIGSFADNSKNANQANFVYDKCRLAELRANLWNFSARRLVLRPFIPGVTQLWSATTVWSSIVTYQVGSVVTFNGVNWVSTAVNNLNSQPGLDFPFDGWQELGNSNFVNPWMANTLYYTGEMVRDIIPGTNIWIPTSPTMALPGTPGSPWVQLLNIFLFTLITFEPLGITTNTISTPKTAFPIPNNYVRVMPQDPKNAATPAQLSTAGMQLTDFEFENGFLMTAKPSPIVFRYAASIQNVASFDPLFCEAVGCRVALELCETITQSPQKAQIINGLYEEAIAKAIRINAIEAGSTEPDQDKVAGNRGPTRERLPPQPRQQ